jgi:hypothetical protein
MKVRTSNHRELERRANRIQQLRYSEPGAEITCRTCGPVMVCDLQEGSGKFPGGVEGLVYWCPKCEQDHRSMLWPKRGGWHLFGTTTERGTIPEEVERTALRVFGLYEWLIEGTTIYSRRLNEGGR